MIYICNNSNYTAFCKAVKFGPVLSQKHSMTVTWSSPERRTQPDGAIWSSTEGGIQPNSKVGLVSWDEHSLMVRFGLPEGGTQPDGEICFS